jgi:hypothetical protein
MATTKKVKKRVFNVRPDTVDFRDQMYTATLVEVPASRSLSDYRKIGAPVLDQGEEGACTGFALATVCHYLLRTRRVFTDKTLVSPAMLYEMAKRYDEWPGEKYEGSSARGAMKGWHKHGVCAMKLWPPKPGGKDNVLTSDRAVDGLQRPLGAYFRVNHKDLVAMHAALAEVGVLYATASVHEGWQRVKSDGLIHQDETIVGGHAFAIVAYDADGFWIQNSWGPGWGRQGFARVRYEDWLQNGSDVWVARLAVPIHLDREHTIVSSTHTVQQGAGYGFKDLRPHVISIGNNGRFRQKGTFATGQADVRAILEQDFPRLTRGWKKKRILVYAHGGLVSEPAALQQVANYREPLLNAQVYPLAFIWKTDFLTNLKNVLDDAVRRRRTEGFLDSLKDFMLDRLDDSLEPLARVLTGKAQWDEIKENALRATTSAEGGARYVAEQLAELARKDSSVEIHLAGHSAGSIFLAPLAQWLGAKGLIATGPLAGQKGLGVRLASCALMAPACTLGLFKESYLPLIRSGVLRNFTLFTLTDQAEQDDNCARIYHKSLLYLVSNAFEQKARIPLVSPEGEPLLGMEKYIRKDADFMALVQENRIHWVLAPNTHPEGSDRASTARHHGDFDDDPATGKALLARILSAAKVQSSFAFLKSPESLRARRQEIQGRVLV